MRDRILLQIVGARRIRRVRILGVTLFVGIVPLRNEKTAAGFKPGLEQRVAARLTILGYAHGQNDRALAVGDDLGLVELSGDGDVAQAYLCLRVVYRDSRQQ